MRSISDLLFIVKKSLAGFGKTGIVEKNADALETDVVVEPEPKKI